MSQSADTDLLQKHVNELSEHFDTVQIFVTRHEIGTDNGTVGACRSAGNWYARLGQVREWLIQQDERARDDIRENP